MGSELRETILNRDIQALRDRLNRRAAIRQALKDFCLFVILPLFVGLIVEGLIS